MGFFDMGGGLAVDYDGSHSTQFASCNYSPREYAADIIEAVMRTMNEAGLEHPTLISESGRATVAHSSVLLFNVFEVTRFEPKTAPAEPAKDAPELVRYLAWVARNLSLESAQENYNDAIYYREEIRRQFQYGSLSLRHRAHADHIFWTVLARIARLISEADAPVPPELERIRDSMIDIYHVNFSVFQSLPDAWAIDQVFPVMPIHRLAEKPEKQGIMADITCDCDGKLDKFIDSRGVRGTLPLHDLKEGEDYLLGAFLVGAYQETLGDLHNLLGDTHVASVYVENGELVFEREIDGDSVADVLNYVEYDTKDLAKQFRDLAERAVRDDRITPAERREVLRSFDHALRTYTYFID
jgi:arginine decarboxylase